MSAPDLGAGLRAALDRLARIDEIWTRAGHRLAPPGAAPEDILRALVQEIDDTVLTARLEIRSTARAADTPADTPPDTPAPPDLVLIAGGRRLRSIAAAAPALDPPPDLEGRVLEAEEPDAIAAAVALLQRFAAAAGTAGAVDLCARPTPRGGDADGGLAAPRLSEALGLVPDDPALPPLDRMLARCAPVLSARLVLKGTTETVRDGDPTLLDLLRAAAIGADPAPHDPDLTLWLPTPTPETANPTEKHPAIAIAQIPAQTPNTTNIAALAFHPKNSKHILATWNAIIPKI